MFKGGSAGVDLASPGAIGGTTPAAGTFTVVTGTAATSFKTTGAGTNTAPTYEYVNGLTGYGTYYGSGGTATGNGPTVVNGGNIVAILGADGIGVRSANGYYFSSTTSALGTADAGMTRAGANAVRFNPGSTATTTSRTEINKEVTAIADNTATAVLTVTIPNGAHSASLRVVLKGAAGGGGAVGADESTRSIEYRVDVTRTAGVNAVATLSAPGMNPAAATVAGGNGITVTGTIGAISGAVGATNTFPINVTIARAAGTATNHICFPYAELINDNANGVTIA